VTHAAYTPGTYTFIKLTCLYTERWRLDWGKGDTTMARINKEIMKKAAEMVYGIFMENGGKIDQAYRADDGALSVSLKARFSPAPGGRVEVKAGISFTESKVRDSVVQIIDPDQMQLFE
jgi:hypothetical protein